jgi:ribosomal protein L37AE/L43A
LIPSTPKKIVCAECKKPISGARTVIKGMWHCSGCTYKHDYPDREISEPVKIGATKKQAETLFPLPPKERE